jgi:hypothetical protein
MVRSLRAAALLLVLLLAPAALADDAGDGDAVDSNEAEEQETVQPGRVQAPDVTYRGRTRGQDSGGGEGERSPEEAELTPP